MSHRPRLALVVVVACVAAGLAWWVSGIWSPMPPRSLTLATGPDGTACALIAERYRDALRRAGIELRVVPTQGSVENLALLRDPASGVGAAFLQSGVASAADASELVSLGTTHYEPLWLLHRRGPAPARLEDLRGTRLAIGPEGSGTRALALQLLAMVGIDAHNAVLLPLGPQAAADALAAGTIDFAALVTSWESPVLRGLLADPKTELVSFPRADAFVARRPFLSRLVVPAGVADLARNIPAADVVLLAPKSSLVVRREMHPALQYLLLDVVSEVHSGPGLFHRAGEFPAAEAIDLPLADEAEQYYRTGRPFLQRYLPFWLAAFAGRLLILVVPLFGLVIPLARMLPGLYGWNARRRIFRFYVELKLIEMEAESMPPGADTAALAARLDDLENQAGHIRVSRFHAATAYTFRHHVRLVRERLERRRAGREPGVPVH